MAVSTLKKVSVDVVLDDGVDSKGNDKYVRVGLGNLSEDYFGDHESDADTKTLAVVTALAACLSKTVDDVEKKLTEEISAA